jgi:pSer/pThr/pTyr-binding forkhead associated (FHA) protein
MKQYALRVISGTAQGTEYPLPDGRELVWGRMSVANVVISDDKTSRRHASVTVASGQVSVQDLGSRNGTYINGERITKETLKPGDHLAVGDCVLVLVTIELPTLEAGTRAGNTVATSERFRGSLREIPLVDLLQMLATARKSGLLVLRAGNETGRVFLEEGHVYYACMEDWLEVDPHKVLYRLLAWTSGTFALEKSDVRPFANPITESTDALLLEGMRQLDELRNLGSDLPPLDAQIAVARPVPGRLAELEDRDLDFIQLVLEFVTVRRVLDHFPGSDFEGYTYLLGMVGRKFLTVNPPAREVRYEAPPLARETNR